MAKFGNNGHHKFDPYGSHFDGRILGQTSSYRFLVCGIRKRILRIIFVIQNVFQYLCMPRNGGHFNFYKIKDNAHVDVVAVYGHPKILKNVLYKKICPKNTLSNAAN